MLHTENPFTPAFGEIPVHLAGRRQVLGEIQRALDSERRRPELTTLFSGARGTGKTTLLSIACHKAEASGWIAVSTTAMDGMLEDIEVQSSRKAAHLVDAGLQAHVSGIGIPQILGLEVERGGSAAVAENWRSRMEDLLDKLAETGTGLMITVDEVKTSLAEMVQLAAFYQHFVREERKVALLMAGLPHHISGLLNSDTVSFLRRAHQVKLGKVDDFEVKSALRKTIVEAGRSIDEASLDHAVAAIDGFPFLMQLVGYYAWDADMTSEGITFEMVEQGIEEARGELASRLLDATFRELSDGDIAFLVAMLPDEGDSAISDIQQRLHKSSSLVSQYRRRLIEAGVIGERRRGVVGFDLPYFKQYVRDRLG